MTLEERAKRLVGLVKDPGLIERALFRLTLAIRGDPMLAEAMRLLEAYQAFAEQLGVKGSTVSAEVFDRYMLLYLDKLIDPKQLEDAVEDESCNWFAAKVAKAVSITMITLELRGKYVGPQE